MPFVENPVAALSELKTRLTDSDCALLMSQRGFVIAEANRSQFVNACVVIHVYNEGRRGVKPLMRELREFADSTGMTRIHGVDINKLPSRHYRRLFDVTGDVRLVGIAYEFTNFEARVH